MATQVNFEDVHITHTVALQRYATNLTDEVIKRIDASESDLLKYLDSKLSRFGSVEPSVKTNKKFTEITAGVKEIRGDAFKNAYSYTTSELVVLAENEATFTQNTLEKVVEDTAITGLTQATVNQIVNQGVFSGQTVKQMYYDLTESDVSRIMTHVRTGMTQGQTSDEIIRGLRGTAKAKYTDGILQITRNQATSVVRTVTNGVSNSAKMAMYGKNSDVISKIKYSATLDSRTSLICASLDGTVWELDDPDIKIPPLHYQCRSTLIPVVKGFEDMSYTRPAAREDFVKNAEDNYNAMAKEKGWSRRWEDLAPSTRDKYYWQEIRKYEADTGKSPFMQVKSKTTFKDYFERQSAEFQKSYLGPARYELYKKGDYEINQFINPATGKTYTIDQLKAMDKEAAKILSPSTTNKQADVLASHPYKQFETDLQNKYQGQSIYIKATDAELEKLESLERDYYNKKRELEAAVTANQSTKLEKLDEYFDKNIPKDNSHLNPVATVNNIARYDNIDKINPIEPLPEDVYLHGRFGRQDLDTGYVVLATQDFNVMEQYAGSTGSGWGLALNKNAKALDMTDEAIREKVAALLKKDYKDGVLSPKLENLIDSTLKDNKDGWEVIKNGFNPNDIVNSAENFDSIDIMEWFENKIDIDMVKTSDGAVFFNPANSDNILTKYLGSSEVIEEFVDWYNEQ